jgi:uncharacterized membrane protein YfcA
MNKNKLYLLIIVIGIFISWSAFMIVTNQLYLFEDNWFMSIVMIFGSFIAGATAEGGGAVAFPVMTLFFDLKPHAARDFCLMIQSFGMLVAAATIVIMRIKFNSQAIIYGSLGGTVGICLGLSYLGDVFSPPFIKMFFTSFWLSFAIALNFIGKNKSRIKKHEPVTPSMMSNVLLLILGVLGGVMSSLVGTGLDILIFSYLTLYSGVSLKIATPTSVILMGINSLIGFIFKHFFIPGGMMPESWDFLLVCIPVVIIGAPLGAIYISEKSKHFVEKILIASITVQFMSSLFIVEQSLKLILFSIFVFLFGALLFFFMGNRKTLVRVLQKFSKNS